MKKFFERPTSEYFETGYLPMVKNIFDESNILSIPKNKIFSQYYDIDKKDFLAYRFLVLKKWIIDNERYTKDYSLNLKAVIEKLNLNNELNSYENQYVKDIESVVFAKIRNLKQLIVDFPIYQGELVFYRYPIKSFNEINQDSIRQHFVDCEIYITTKRIIISEHLNTLSIPYSLIKNYEFKMDELIFNLNNKKKYSVKANDIPTLYVSLERTLQREKLFLNK